MDEIKKKLEDEIKSEISDLSKLKAGSEEKSKAITDLTKLNQSRIDIMKAETTLLEHQDRHELERDKHYLEEQTRDEERRLKEAEHKSRNIGQWIMFGGQIGTTLLTMLAYNYWFKKGLKFEETGTITSPHNRNLISSMLPKFKK